MSRIIRRELPPRYGKYYRRARPYLRRDFLRRCAYCLIHDEDIGEGFFEIDHFYPQAQGGTDDYTNLYYVCRVCNAQKHHKWPSEVEQANGLGFCDPCKEWDYGVHFVEQNTGVLSQKTPKGEYHIDQIFLNRTELIEKRRYRNDLMVTVEELKRRIETSMRDTDEARGWTERLDRIQRRIDLFIPRLPER